MADVTFRNLLPLSEAARLTDPIVAQVGEAGCQADLGEALL